MGSVSLKIGDGTARFKKTTLFSSALNLLMLVSILFTNLFAFYAFTSPSKLIKINPFRLYHKNNNDISPVSHQVSLILREIESSQHQLSQMEKQLIGYESIDLSRPNISKELKIFLKHHNLPLGKDSRTGVTQMVSSIGHSCEKSMDLLTQYMNYKVNEACPDDWSLAQKLISRGCEPLPRRRCFAESIPKMGHLQKLPNSLWSNVSTKILQWSGLGCKNLACLQGKKINRDCVDCFDLVNGFEKQRYLKARGKNDFLIDDVLAFGNGDIRVGFDLGGGSGTFAARLAEKDVTVITATLNKEAPFSDFIAARGLFPLFLSLDHRFPIFDNVFDLVRAGPGLDVGGRPEKLEFVMFDVDRVLRPGGLLWIDNFYCSSDLKRKAFTQLIEVFGYKKLKWVLGEKVNAAGRPEIFLSAVLLKRVRI